MHQAVPVAVAGRAQAVEVWRTREPQNNPRYLPAHERRRHGL